MPHVEDRMRFQLISASVTRRIRRGRSSRGLTGLGDLGIAVRSWRGGDPSPPLFRLDRRKHPDFARDQKSDRLHGVPDPAGVGDDRNPLAAREKFSRPEIEILPGGAGKARAELVIEADLVMIFERFPHRRHQDVAAVLHRQASADGKADDVFRKPSDEFDHDGLFRKRRATSS